MHIYTRVHTWQIYETILKKLYFILTKIYICERKRHWAYERLVHTLTDLISKLNFNYFDSFLFSFIFIYLLIYFIHWKRKKHFSVQDNWVVILLPKNERAYFIKIQKKKTKQRCYRLTITNNLKKWKNIHGRINRSQTRIFFYDGIHNKYRSYEIYWLDNSSLNLYR